jgi:hypothetical protein
MSAAEGDNLQDTGTENSASQTEQPAGPNVFPPFSGNLIVDKELKLRQENFKQTIYDFFNNKDTTTLSQLTETPPFPTAHVPAQFASKANTDSKKRENDAKCEEWLPLPDGWKLLTTASNSSKDNGYFGAAYWHAEHQQVVIAHRGTDPKNVGTLWTDLVGVIYNYHVPQMHSASTFAHKVEVLREVTREKRPIFLLFLTGHVLGVG